MAAVDLVMVGRIKVAADDLSKTTEFPLLSVLQPVFIAELAGCGVHAIPGDPVKDFYAFQYPLACFFIAEIKIDSSH